MNTKNRLLFVYDHKYPHLLRDGLWAALELLKEDFELTKFNLQDRGKNVKIGPMKDFDFILGWGAFNSPVELSFRELKQKSPKTKVGLCIAGNAFPPDNMNLYDVLFYETNWYEDQLKGHKHALHAFGVNTDIFNPWKEAPVIWDYISVGSFSYWKRHESIISKPGTTKMVIGEIQKDNWSESFDIISYLLLAGVAVSDMVYPSKLRNFYNCANKVFIPAEINGGGERAVLEARACGKTVEIADDNPKLQELLDGPVYDHHYYKSKLLSGIMEVL